MKNTAIWVIVVLVLLVGIFWFMGSSVEAPVAEEGTGQSVTLALSEQNDSGISGAATLTVLEEGGTQVTLDLSGAPEDFAQPAHIHSGSCADIGGISYPLESPVNGQSVTMIDVSLDTLMSELPLALNVHKSPEELEIYVACGDLGQ